MTQSRRSEIGNQINMSSSDFSPSPWLSRTESLNIITRRKSSIRRVCKRTLEHRLWVQRAQMQVGWTKIWLLSQIRHKRVTLWIWRFFFCTNFRQLLSLGAGSWKEETFDFSQNLTRSSGPKHRQAISSKFPKILRDASNLVMLVWKSEKPRKITRKFTKRHQLTPKTLWKLAWNHLTLFRLTFKKNRRFPFLHKL